MDLYIIHKIERVENGYLVEYCDIEEKKKVFKTIDEVTDFVREFLK